MSTARAPCLIYGYGSYEASEPPWFSPARLSLLDRGFVWALAHPRGGGELGRRWYLDGKLLNKRNTFLDTSPSPSTSSPRLGSPSRRVAIRGGSAGGLLVGACMTMRPETVRRCRRRGAVRRRRHDDVRRGAAVDDHRVGRAGQPGHRAACQLHAELLAVRPDDRPRLPGRSSSPPGSTTSESAITSPPSGSPSCAPFAPTTAPLIMRCEMGAGTPAQRSIRPWREEARTLTFPRHHRLSV